MNQTKTTLVRCSLKDCFFYQAQADQPGMCYCKHPEVRFHRNDRRCPLYRMDWGSKMGAAELLTKRIKNT